MLILRIQLKKLSIFLFKITNRVIPLHNKPIHIFINFQKITFEKLMSQHKPHNQTVFEYNLSLTRPLSSPPKTSEIIVETSCFFGVCLVSIVVVVGCWDCKVVVFFYYEFSVSCQNFLPGRNFLVGFRFLFGI